MVTLKILILKSFLGAHCRRSRSPASAAINLHRTFKNFFFRYYMLYMVDLKYKGRLGNNLIQYAAGYILAKKAGLALNKPARRIYGHTGHQKTTASNDEIVITKFDSIFKIKKPTGKSYNKIIELNDSNYYEHLNNPKKNTSYKLNGYFQDGRLLCEYRKEILDLYRYKKKPKIDISQNDAFVACRLGDCLLKSHVTRCTTEYIENQLKTNRHNYRNVYITSDSLDYPPLVKLIDEYNITPYNNSPLNTILFAKNFNNLILSAGSFSYWMAYLSKANNVTVYGDSKIDALQKHNAWAYNKNVKFTK